MQLLRNHQGGAFSLPDALRGLGLRRIDLDMVSSWLLGANVGVEEESG